MRRATAGFAVATAALALAGGAAAHPQLVETQPAAKSRLNVPPTRVVVRLTEPAEPVGDGIRIIGPDGREVGRGPVRVAGSTLSRAVDARQRGTYVVDWLVVGDDTHPASGAFLFSVGEPTRSTLPGHFPGGVAFDALGRWLTLFGFALGFGVVFAALLSGGMTDRLWRLVSTGVVLMIVSEPIALLGQIVTLAPSRMLEPAFARDVLLTSYGHLAALRLGAALGLWALAGALRESSTRAQWSIPVAGVAVAFVYAGSAHPLAGLPSPVPQLLAATHVTAFAAWFGCAVVAVADSRALLLARAAVFSALALVLSGSALVLAHLEGFSDLVETAYGTTLAVKLALVALAFALGAASRHRAELAAALAALAAAAVLVSLAPPV